MNTVIPISGNHIANHFTKAESFLFVDSQGRHTNTLINPVLNCEACSAKKTIVEMFKAEKVKRVIVRNIGQRSLEKLLTNEMQVFQSGIRHIENAILLDNEHRQLTALTTIEQGRRSLIHEKKGSECSCHNKTTDNTANCDFKLASSDSEISKKCCEQPFGKAHGKGKCHH